MNVLFHQAALGDFVLTFPLLRALAGPTTVVAPWSRAALAARMFERVTPMDIEMWEFTRLHARGGPTSVSPAVGDLFSQARCIVSFVGRRGDPWAANVARLAPKAKLVHLTTRPPGAWDGHVSQWHRQQLEKHGVACVDPEARPRSTPAASRKTKAKTRPWRLSAGPLVVHPGSGGRDKCWPIECFEVLIEDLIAAGRTVTVILGEAEVERWPESTVQRWRQQYDAHPLASVDELYGLLTTAAGYIGNDAGPTHLAAQLGIPTLALFGPSDPRTWAPIGPQVKVLAPRTPRPMDWLSVDAVLAACEVA